MPQTFWEILCATVPIQRVFLGGTFTLILLSIFAILFIQPESEAYYITLANLAILIPLTLALWGVLQYCHRRDPLEGEL